MKIAYELAIRKLWNTLETKMIEIVFRDEEISYASNFKNYVQRYCNILIERSMLI